ncbi:hypothetical protein DFH07DRAFT_766923 [Mycena maculata]|uniref:Uncharacterized protein n=1 Tax=Mycena maculata TaxID=230809 RepID=A0AAD7K0X3_9AGAR|nr:hypothetical protein DFH07DRAFT_766923 [Mycena maculata]
MHPLQIPTVTPGFSGRPPFDSGAGHGRREKWTAYLPFIQQHYSLIATEGSRNENRRVGPSFTDAAGNQRRHVVPHRNPSLQCNESSYTVRPVGIGNTCVVRESDSRRTPFDSGAGHGLEIPFWRRTPEFSLFLSFCDLMVWSDLIGKAANFFTACKSPCNAETRGSMYDVGTKMAHTMWLVAAELNPNRMVHLIAGVHIQTLLSQQKKSAPEEHGQSPSVRELCQCVHCSGCLRAVGLGLCLASRIGVVTGYKDDDFRLVKFARSAQGIFPALAQDHEQRPSRDQWRRDIYHFAEQRQGHNRAGKNSARSMEDSATVQWKVKTGMRTAPAKYLICGPLVGVIEILKEETK